MHIYYIYICLTFIPKKQKKQKNIIYMAEKQERNVYNFVIYNGSVPRGNRIQFPLSVEAPGTGKSIGVTQLTQG